jgi:leader peptidase (prepilin peptidase)/N-methyltransferase
MPMAGMEIWFAALATLWGAIWGSFANVAIYRLPRGLSVMRPGSACPHCTTPIKWFHNIPVLSYLLLGGKCAYCKAPISFQYPMVELIVAVLALAIWQRAMFDPIAITMGDRAVLFMFRFAFVLGLVIIIFADLETMLIPDLVALPGIVLGVAASMVIHPHTGVDWMASLIGAAAGAGVVMLIRTVYWVVFRIEGMGFGDVKLMAMIGAFLGWQSLVFVFFAGSMQGLFYAVIAYAVGMKHQALGEEAEVGDEAGAEAPPAASFRRMVIPFGPFLSLAALEWLFFSAQIIALQHRIFML